MDISSHYKNKGYVILKNVIKNNDINEIRKILNNHFESNKSKRMETLDYFNNTPEIYNLQFNSEIIDACKKIFGSNYSINNSVQIQYNMFGISGKFLGWHIDCGHEFSQKENDYLFDSKYQFAKIGIYLQDNTIDYGGGIDLVKCSHRAFKFKYFTKLYLKLKLLILKFSKTHSKSVFTEAGDAIIFDSRLLHRSTINSKTLDKSQSNNQITERNMFNNPENSKIAIYWSVGNSSSNEKFVADMKKRAYMEIEQNSIEKIYNEYLSFYYPDSYCFDYKERVKKNSLNISTLSKEESKKYLLNNYEKQ